MTTPHELYELLKAYDPHVNESLIVAAYDFTVRAHGAQLRASGAPYYLHPLEVAKILIDYKLDVQSIITGLLHDTVEDTVATIEEITELFGPEVAALVEGVTKLSRLEIQSEHLKQAENLRKLVVAMSTDIRVLLVKLADRLHNMRTIQFVPLEKRMRIARETKEIYVPLAERIGMQNMKDELEDHAFSVLNPQAHESISQRLSHLYESNGTTVDTIIKDLLIVFNKESLPADINGRKKTPSSIWRKMQNKNIAFEQLADIMAFRIIVDTLAQCYEALGIIHSHYPVIPGRFKDFISTPKPNNYKSLHTVVIGPLNHRIEIQIRTRDMHMVNEYGVAAHWHYKQGGEASTDGRQYAWLRGLMDILEQTATPEEFLEHTKLEMFQDQVFCFTPKSDLIALPRGACVIDFAYALHSAIGNQTVSAKINGKLAPLRTILSNGDQIEIQTSKSQHPSPEWERFVITGKARAQIRRFIRQSKRQQFSELGKNLLMKCFRHEHVEYCEKTIQTAVEHYHFTCSEDLFVSIAEGYHAAKDVFLYCHPHTKPKATPTSDVPVIKKKSGDKVSLSINGLIPGMAIHMSGCCHPLPGDRIVGLIITGRGISIHTYDCDHLQDVDNADRLLDISWGHLSGPERAQHHYVGRIKVTFVNKPGSLASMTGAISKQAGNIMNLKVTNRTTDFWDLLVDVEVQDAQHLSHIIAALRTVPIMVSADRG